MKLFEKEKGHTLIELIIVMTLVSIVMVLMGTIYLSIHSSYLRVNKKAQNLENAKVMINHLTDHFQSYKGCKVVTKDHGNLIELVETKPGENDELAIKAASEAAKLFYPVEKIIFYNDKPSDYNGITVAFQQTAGASNDSPTKGRLIWKKRGSSNEVQSEIASFKAKLEDELLELRIELVEEGYGLVPNQTIEIGTTFNLKYMKKGQDLAPEV